MVQTADNAVLNLHRMTNEGFKTVGDKFGSNGSVDVVLGGVGETIRPTTSTFGLTLVESTEKSEITSNVSFFANGVR